MSARASAVLLLLCAALAAAIVAPGRGSANPGSLDAAGLLALPDERVAPVPAGLVIAVHEPTGIDPRGWAYGDQILAAGIAVLHTEALDTSADGFAPHTGPDEDAAALARLMGVIGRVASDPRFANAPVGLLAFGGAGRIAVRAAADEAAGGRIGALVLLYPGCAGLEAALVAGDVRPRAPVLLLHGDADPANPPAECDDVAARIARTAPVRKVRYAGAGYAWDRPLSGPYESLKLPWPGRPGARVPVSYWPAAAEVSASQAAGFLAAALAPAP